MFIDILNTVVVYATENGRREANKHSRRGKTMLVVGGWHGLILKSCLKYSKRNVEILTIYKHL